MDWIGGGLPGVQEQRSCGHEIGRLKKLQANSKDEGVE